MSAALLPKGVESRDKQEGDRGKDTAAYSNFTYLVCI